MLCRVSLLHKSARFSHLPFPSSPSYLLASFLIFFRFRFLSNRPTSTDNNKKIESNLQQKKHFKNGEFFLLVFFIAFSNPPPFFPPQISASKKCRPFWIQFEPIVKLQTKRIPTNSPPFFAPHQPHFPPVLSILAVVLSPTKEKRRAQRSALLGRFIPSRFMSLFLPCMCSLVCVCVCVGI